MVSYWDEVLIRVWLKRFLGGPKAQFRWTITSQATALSGPPSGSQARIVVDPSPVLSPVLVQRSITVSTQNRSGIQSFTPRSVSSVRRVAGLKTKKTKKTNCKYLKCVNKKLSEILFYVWTEGEQRHLKEKNFHLVSFICKTQKV